MYHKEIGWECMYCVQLTRIKVHWWFVSIYWNFWFQKKSGIYLWTCHKESKFLIYWVLLYQDYMAQDDETTGKLERIRNEVVVAYSRYYPRICTERLRKTTMNLILVSECPGRGSNRAPTTKKSRALFLDQPASCLDSALRDLFPVLLKGQ